MANLFVFRMDLVHHQIRGHCPELPRLRLAVCLVAVLPIVAVESKSTRPVEFFFRSTFSSSTLFTGVTTSTTKPIMSMNGRIISVLKPIKKYWNRQIKKRLSFYLNMALQSSKKGFLNASYVSSFTSPCFCCAWLDFWEIGGLKSWCENILKCGRRPPGIWPPFGSQNGLFYPVLVVFDFCVNSRDIATSTTDSEADDPDLIPLPIFLANQRTSSVSLWKYKIHRVRCKCLKRTRPKPRETLCKAFLLKWEMHVFAWTVWDVTFVPFLEDLPMRDSHNQIELGKVAHMCFLKLLRRCTRYHSFYFLTSKVDRRDYLHGNLIPYDLGNVCLRNM